MTGTRTPAWLRELAATLACLGCLATFVWALAAQDLLLFLLSGYLFCAAGWTLNPRP